MRSTHTVRSALALVFAFAACSNNPAGPEGGDDALVFANSSGAEIDVTLTLPGGATRNVTLPTSTTAGETRVDVSFVEGDVYTFVLSHPSVGLSPVASCTVSALAVQSGVASILVYLNTQIRSVVGECLTNWVESAG